MEEKLPNKTAAVTDESPIKSLLVVFSYHTMSTMKIAQVMADILTAPIITPQEMIPEDIQNYDLVGFGSGIYDAKHHTSLLALADTLPVVTNKNCFLFSTAGVSGEKKVFKDHSRLRSKLEGKGYTIVDEFGCKGFNTNSFLKFFGGMNKGRPNVEDLNQAKIFAQNLI